jgi:hypothetical protein
VRAEAEKKRLKKEAKKKKREEKRVPFYQNSLYLCEKE